MEILIIIAFGSVVYFAAQRTVRRIDRRTRSMFRPERAAKPVRKSAQLRAVPNAPFDPKTAEPKRACLIGRAHVTDGDTITIAGTQIRLFGIDAPELNHPHGQKAKWAMIALCKGQDIRADVTEVDEYGRTVAHCTLPDGRDLSAELVRQGLAIDWPKYSGGRYRHLEVPDARKKMWLADARQKGRMHVWAAYDAKQKARANRD